MSDHPSLGYAKPRSRRLRWLFRSPVAALASHWFWQSLLVMDPAERRFKLGMDLVLTLGCGSALRRWLPAQLAALAAWFLAHTVNFLLNGQIWGALKGYGLVHWHRAAFEAYVAAMAARARGEPSIHRFLAYGSLSRDAWEPSSDLDARILRAPGLVNGLRSCAFLMRERTRALVAGFPLDVYVVDSPAALGRLRSDEIGFDLLARESSGLVCPPSGEL